MSGLSRTKVKTINPATGGSAADGAALLPTNYTTDTGAGLHTGAYPTGASAAGAAYPTGAGVSTGASYAYPTGAAPLNKPTGHTHSGAALYKQCGCLRCLEVKAVLDVQYYRQLQKQAPPPPMQEPQPQMVYYHAMLTGAAAPQHLATGAAAPQHLATGAAAAPQHLATGAAPHQCFTGCDCKPKSSGYIPAAATGAPPRDAYPATFQPAYTPNFQ